MTFAVTNTSLAMIPERFHCDVTEGYRVSLMCARARVLAGMAQEPERYLARMLLKSARDLDRVLLESSDSDAARDRVGEFERRLFERDGLWHLATEKIVKGYARSSSARCKLVVALAKQLGEGGDADAAQVLAAKSIVEDQVQKMAMAVAEEFGDDVKVYAVVGDSVVMSAPGRADECSAVLAKEFKEFGVRCCDTTTIKSSGASSTSVDSSDYTMV